MLGGRKLLQTIIFKTKTLTQLYHAVCGDYTLALANHPFIFFYFWKTNVRTREREWKSKTTHFCSTTLMRKTVTNEENVIGPSESDK